MDKYLLDDRWKEGYQIHDTRTPCSEGILAIHLIERWGSVAGKPDGEDTAGRAKIGLQTPRELVDRACNTAEITFAELEKRGWMLEMPKREPKPDKDKD